MQITLTLQHVDLTSAERDRLAEMSERLSLYFRNVMTVRWVINRVAKMYDVTMKVHARSGYYYARTHVDRAGKGIDFVFDRIIRQRRRRLSASLTARSQAGIDALRCEGSLKQIDQPAGGMFWLNNLESQL